MELTLTNILNSLELTFSEINSNTHLETGLELTFAVLRYFQKSWLDLTFVELTFTVLSYFQKSGLDLTFVEITLTSYCYVCRS